VGKREGDFRGCGDVAGAKSDGACVGAQDLLPGIINQLGPDNLENLKKIAEQYTGGAVAGAEGSGDGDDDDDVPDLVEGDFEQASKQ